MDPAFVTLRTGVILGISLVALLIALILDRLFVGLPSTAARILIQIPLLVLTIDLFRRWALETGPTIGLTDTDVNASFFLTPPLVALGSANLFAAIRRIVF
jgi:hypothetical protein